MLREIWHRIKAFISLYRWGRRPPETPEWKPYDSEQD